MDRAALIDLVESKHRMTISPTDPVFILATISEAISAETVGRAEAAADRVEAAARQIDASRMPVQNEQLRMAVIQGIRSYAAETIKTTKRQTIVVGASAAVVTLLCIAGGAYWFGQSSGFRDGFNAGSDLGLKANEALSSMPPTEAVAWAALLRNNTGLIAEMWDECRKRATVQNGRRTCPLQVWAEVPPVPTPGQH